MRFGSEYDEYNDQNSKTQALKILYTHHSLINTPRYARYLHIYREIHTLTLSVGAPMAPRFRSDDFNDLIRSRYAEANATKASEVSERVKNSLMAG